MILASPLTRSVSFMPGIRKSSPTAGLTTMFSSVSSRLLPGRSGMAIVLSSSTAAKPGLSPFGVTSALPLPSDEPISTNGLLAMKERQWPSSRFSSLRIEPAVGSGVL